MWKDASKKQKAASALRYTADDVARMGCVDDVIREPEGGAHVDPACAMQMVNERLERHFNDLTAMPIEQLLAARYNKFRNIAQFYRIA